MNIESRGIPPYKVSSGAELPKSDPLYSGAEQFSSVETFQAAFELIFDHSNAGQRLVGQYIQDSEPKVVFTVENPADVTLLHEADKVGLTRVIFT